MKDTHFTRHEHTIMDEPGFLLRAVTWHIGSGDAIFIAWILLLIAATMHARGFHGSRVLLVTVLAVFWMALGNGITMTGLVMIVLLVIVASIKKLRRPGPSGSLSPKNWYITLGCCMLGLNLELHWHWPIVPIKPDATSVAIIGDSVTAGLNAADVTWPQQLAQSTSRTIYDASQQGATVTSALPQLDKLGGRGDLLWIEIGGNDILESLPVDLYAERLESLLQSARKKYRTIVMMEIPAPPGGGGYGDRQRRLSKKYDIPLVPKRQFLAVLTTSGSTQDGVHLANAGHQRMASLVEKTLGWTNSPQPGTYFRID